MANEVVELAFRSVVEGISATLKCRGFTKRGTAYRHLSRGNAGIIQVQRSQSSSKQLIRFTMNVGVISGSLLDGLEVELTKATEIHAHLRRRIGSFLSPPVDKWWNLDATSNSSAVLAELEPLLDAAAHYVLAHLTDQRLIALWETGQSPGLTEVQRQRHLRDLKAAKVS